MKDTPPKYQLRIDEKSKYDWVAVVVDMTVEPPSATSIMAKSMAELMAKVLVALVLHDKNLGIPEGEQAPTTSVDNGNGVAPIILTPSKRIITN